MSDAKHNFHGWLLGNHDLIHVHNIDRKDNNNFMTSGNKLYY